MWVDFMYSVSSKGKFICSASHKNTLKKNKKLTWTDDMQKNTF